MMKTNRFLKDRASHRRYDSRHMDYSPRHHYRDSRFGGPADDAIIYRERENGLDSRSRRDSMYDSRRDRNYDMRREDEARRGRSRDSRDYAYDYNYDYNYSYDYAEDSEMEEYKKDLKRWIEKLKKDDKFNMTKEQVLELAKRQDVRFEEYDELEFYAIFLMLTSDYKDILNDPTVVVKMAKEFLEDDDIEVSPSEKVCIYLYKIVKGE